MIDGSDNNKTIIKGDLELGLVDYAILKSLTTGIWTIQDIVNLLQIRGLIIEKHIYDLTRVGFVDTKIIGYFRSQYFDITQKGKEFIYSFERDNPIDKWQPVEGFIINSVENRKKRKIMFYKTLDFILLIVMAIIIILIIYFGIYYQ